jgi:hypothetical protein
LTKTEEIGMFDVQLNVESVTVIVTVRGPSVNVPDSTGSILMSSVVPGSNSPQVGLPPTTVGVTPLPLGDPGVPGSACCAATGPTAGLTPTKVATNASVITTIALRATRRGGDLIERRMPSPFRRADAALPERVSLTIGYPSREE